MLSVRMPRRVNVMGPQARGYADRVELLASRHSDWHERNGYERVLSDAMKGDRALFAREDYVEEAWRIVDPVVNAGTELYEYEPGSWGQRQRTSPRRAGGTM
jgi:glucose-6-phosphate 1-dehydrogenase